MSASLDNFLDRLSSLSSAQGHDPRQFDWPESIGDDWCFSPELVSIYGTPLWASLGADAQKRLAFYEAVNFFSLNVHGERHLIGELGRRVYDGGAALARYLVHFIAEEAQHMMYFSGFCERYADGVFPDRTVHPADTGNDDAELATLLVFARINLFEEIVDHYNRTMARDERLSPVVREIHRIHHVEEMRHLAFGRRVLADRLRSDPVRSAAVKASLASYLEFTWRQYYSVDAYRAAGLERPLEVWQEAWSLASSAGHRRSVNRLRLNHLANLGLLEMS